jgi:YD repeat-containing protein
MKNLAGGEEVNYQYDSLGRLSLAETTGPEWGQRFSYDGFGNLVSEQVTKGMAFSMNLNYDAATNRGSCKDYAFCALVCSTGYRGIMPL